MKSDWICWNIWSNPNQFFGGVELTVTPATDANVSFKKHNPYVHCDSPVAAMTDPWNYVAYRDINL